MNSSVKSSQFSKITVSKIKDDAKTRIKQETGSEVKRVVMDNCSVRHSLKRADHHITLSDFKKLARIINRTTDIKLQRNHMDNKAVLFTEGKKNGLRIVMEIREKKGELALVTMYRPKKAK